MLPRVTRRQWLQLAGGVVVAGGLGAAWHRARQRTIRIGMIGAGERAEALAHGINGTGWFSVNGRIVAICDVDSSRAEALRGAYAPAAAITQDFHRLLARDEVDAVFVATPDHWHVPVSIAALRAGKHVYCEKPLTLTIAEGRQIVEAVRCSGRTFLVGTQQRSDPRFQLACMLVRNGRLGQLKRIEIALRENLAGGPFAPQPVPPTLDWDRWLGPAPAAEFCPERFRIFRPWFEYSGGSMTDWGAHHVDIAQWAMGMEDSGPVEISGVGKLPEIENGFSAPLTYTVDMRYSNGVTVHVRTGPTEGGLLFEGDAGRVLVNRGRIRGKPVEDLATNPFPPDAVRLGHRRSYWGECKFVHVQHFFDCIVTGAVPISDVASQHRSVSACHLANISLRLQRPVKWIPESETFVNDPEATALLRRESRTV